MEFGQKEFREIDLFDFTTFFGLDFFKFSGPHYGRNENETAFGEQIESALDALVASSYLVGVGINCVSLRYASKLIDKFVSFQQDYQLKNPDFKLEIIAYPNSGEIYNGQDMEWISDPDCKGTFIEHSEELAVKGATILGGCCRVFASDICQLSECVKNKKSI